MTGKKNHEVPKRSTRGFWLCCVNHCCNFNNPVLWPLHCCDCNHRRCSTCKTFQVQLTEDESVSRTSFSADGSVSRTSFSASEPRTPSAEGPGESSVDIRSNSGSRGSRDDDARYGTRMFDFELPLLIDSLTLVKRNQDNASKKIEKLGADVPDLLQRPGTGQLHRRAETTRTETGQEVYRPAASRRPHSPRKPASTPKSWAQCWTTYLERWDALSNGGDDGIPPTRNDIPWPVNSGRRIDVCRSAINDFYSNIPLDAIQKRNKEEKDLDPVVVRRKFLEDETKRWHPDNHLEMFLRWKESDKEGDHLDSEITLIKMFDVYQEFKSLRDLCRMLDDGTKAEAVGTEAEGEELKREEVIRKEEKEEDRKQREEEKEEGQQIGEEKEGEEKEKGKENPGEKIFEEFPKNYQSDALKLRIQTGEALKDPELIRLQQSLLDVEAMLTEGEVVAKPKQYKSRNACVNCKAKRLRCDERKPTCRVCERTAADCGGYRKKYKWRPIRDLGSIKESSEQLISCTLQSEERQSEHDLAVFRKEVSPDRKQSGEQSEQNAGTDDQPQQADLDEEESCITFFQRQHDMPPVDDTPGLSATGEVKKGFLMVQLVSASRIPAFLSSKMLSATKRLEAWAEAEFQRLWEPPLERGKRRLRWRCTCGYKSFDDYIELRPGAVARMESALRQRYQDGQQNSNARSVAAIVTSFVGRFGFPIFGLRRGTSGLPQHRINAQIQAINNITVTTPPGLLHVLLSFPFCTRGSKLYQPNVQTVLSDRAFFELLKLSYQSSRGSFLKKIFSLKTIKSVKFVYLEMYRSRVVDIRKTDDLPPVSETGYIYEPKPPEMVPPVGENVMMHFLQHPEHADGDKTICFERIPKKEGALTVCPVKGTGLGWGIHFVEGWYYSLLWLALSIMVVTASFVFFVCWAILKNDIQGASAVAAYILALLGLAMASIQAGIELEVL